MEALRESTFRSAAASVGFTAALRSSALSRAWNDAGFRAAAFRMAANRNAEAQRNTEAQRNSEAQRNAKN
jgi:hypothetical protein